MFVIESMISQLLPPAARFSFMPVLTTMTLCLDGFLSPSGTIVKTNIFSVSCLGYGVLLQQKKSDEYNSISNKNTIIKLFPKCQAVYNF